MLSNYHCAGGRTGDPFHFLFAVQRTSRYNATGIMVIVRCFLVLCIIAGLGSRALVGPSGCVEAISAQQQFGCCEHELLPEHHDGDHPVEHHHHEFCSHGVPLLVESQVAITLLINDGALIEIRPENEVRPNAPCLGLEKPPLI